MLSNSCYSSDDMKQQKPSQKKTADKSTLAPGLERLERALAHQGLASRREAKALISAGQVKVNGKTVTEPGYGITIGKDAIVLNGTQQKESVLVYKPRGIETNKTSEKSRDLHDYFPGLAHLAPIGRLDKESEGLIIMSNDGTLARALTQEDSMVGKTYKVTVRENVTDHAIAKMSSGIVLDKVKTRPAVVRRLSRTSFSIVLHEGRKHQIRRMADACHLTIEELIRTTIGTLSIGTLKAGQKRTLSPAEVAQLKKGA